MGFHAPHDARNAADSQAARDARTRASGDLPSLPTAKWPTPAPYPGSAVALKVAQDAKIQKEADRLYTGAVKRTRKALEEYGADASGSTMFDGTAQADDVVSAVAARNKEVRQEEEAQKAEDRHEREEVARMNSPWEALYQWAGIACMYIQGGYEIDSEGAYLRSHYVVMRRSEIDAGLAQDKRLNSCERGVIKMARDAPDPVDIESMMKWMDYRQGGGALGVFVRGMAKAIEAVPVAVVHGIEAPFVWAASDSGSDSSGSTSDHVERSERGGSDRQAPDNWNSLNQLRGFTGFH